MKNPTPKQKLQLKCKELKIKYQNNDTMSMLEAAIRGKEIEAKLKKSNIPVTVLTPELPLKADWAEHLAKVKKDLAGKGFSQKEILQEASKSFKELKDKLNPIAEQIEPVIDSGDGLNKKDQEVYNDVNSFFQGVMKQLSEVEGRMKKHNLPFKTILSNPRFVAFEVDGRFRIPEKGFMPIDY